MGKHGPEDFPMPVTWLPASRLGFGPLVALLLLAPLAGAPEPASAKKSNKPVCESGTFFAEGLPPLAVGEDRALGDFVVIDVEAGTLRIAGCAPVPTSIKGKQNQKLKAELPLGTCPGVDASGKLKLRLKDECALAKGKVRFKTQPRLKRKLEARRGDGTVVMELEEENAVTETIGPAGGSLETTDSEGRHYQLDIPEGAIVAERSVTLTPVAAMSGLAVDSLLAAADFEPAGMRLVPPATLSAELPEPAEPEGRAGFGYSQGGALELHPFQLEGGTWSVPVWHFSAAGFASVGQSAASQAFWNQASAAFGDPQLLAAICATWFDSVIEPLLVSANSDARLGQAVADANSWIYTSQCGTVSPARAALAFSLLRTALEDGVARAHIRCRTLQTFESVADALVWQTVASLFVIDTGALNEAAVLAGTCLEVAYVDTSYPGNPPVGVNQTLSVTVGASFDGGSPVFTQPLQVDVTASGASPANGGGQTDSSGTWSGSFAADGSGDASFRINSCIGAPAYPALSVICQEALVVRGLEVDPSSATLAGGDTQQFDAVRFGASYTNVTWSASSGSISSAGLYTAPDAVGSYVVTATDNADPASTATASVTVTTGGGGGSTGCVAVNVGQLTHQLSANVQMNDQTDFSGSGSSSGVSASLGATGCLATGTSSGFGNIEATITADAEGCPGTVRAGAASFDHVGITPADPTRFVATVRGRFELELSGSSSPGQSFDAIEASVHSALGAWHQPGGVPFPSLASGSAIQDVRTLEVELQNQPGQKTFPMAWRVDVQANMLSSDHSANVTARARWLGFTELLDQDGAPILDYDVCSNSSNDYRNPAP
jgi:hypothetical protein